MPLALARETAGGACGCPNSVSYVHTATKSLPKGAECQVPGCKVDLRAENKPYCLQKRICSKHMQADVLKFTDQGKGYFRFCFQCGRVEPLSRFDGVQRSCRAKLNKRRNKVKPALTGCAAGTASGATDAAQQGSPCPPSCAAAAAAAAQPACTIEAVPQPVMSHRPACHAQVDPAWQQLSTGVAATTAAAPFALPWPPQSEQQAISYSSSDISPGDSSTSWISVPAAAAAAAPEVAAPAAAAAATQPAAEGNNHKPEGNDIFFEELLNYLLAEELGVVTSPCGGNAPNSNEGSSNASSSSSLEGIPVSLDALNGSLNCGQTWPLQQQAAAAGLQANPAAAPAAAQACYGTGVSFYAAPSATQQYAGVAASTAHLGMVQPLRAEHAAAPAAAAVHMHAAAAAPMQAAMSMPPAFAARGMAAASGATAGVQMVSEGALRIVELEAQLAQIESCLSALGSCIQAAWTDCPLQ